MERPLETRTLGEAIATEVLCRPLHGEWVEITFCTSCDDGDLYEKVRVVMPRGALMALAKLARPADSIELPCIPRTLMH